MRWKRPATSNHNYVGTEHILLGLLREQEGVAAQILMNLGLKLEEVREEVLNLLGQRFEDWRRDRAVPRAPPRESPLGDHVAMRRTRASRRKAIAARVVA